MPCSRAAAAVCGPITTAGIRAPVAASARAADAVVGARPALRVDLWMLAAVVVSTAVPLVFSRFEPRVAPAANSPALTADALETGKRACQDAGMDGFLTKPVNPTELDAMLADLFSRSDDAEPHNAAAA